MAIGTELGSIELYSLKLMVKGRREDKVGRQRSGDLNSLQKSTSSSFIKCYHTKLNGVLLAKFSWRNFLTTVGCIEKMFN